MLGCLYECELLLGLYEGQALRVIGEQTFLWTSEQARGLKTPVFRNKGRVEILCKVGGQVDVSNFFTS